MVYTGATMPLPRRSRATSAPTKHVRRSVTLPPKIAKQVDIIAKERDLSDNRVLVELIEQGIEARQQREKAFFQLAERFRAADDPEQVKQLGEQLGRLAFGE
jgi:predicted transcriptional regulator